MPADMGASLKRKNACADFDDAQKLAEAEESRKAAKDAKDLRRLQAQTLRQVLHQCSRITARLKPILDKLDNVHAYTECCDPELQATIISTRAKATRRFEEAQRVLQKVRTGDTRDMRARQRAQLYDDGAAAAGCHEGSQKAQEAAVKALHARAAQCRAVCAIHARGSAFAEGFPYVTTARAEKLHVRRTARRVSCALRVFI